MGWYYGEASKQAVIDDITKGWVAENGNRHLTIAKSVRGNTLYTVNEVLTYNDGIETAERYIGIYLLGKSGGDWGYKPMDESMGAYNYDCPLYFFDLAPIIPGGYAREWRDKVREHHRNKAKRKGAQVGQTIVFKPGVKFHGRVLDREVVTMVSGTKVYVRLFGYDVRVLPKHVERIER